MSSVFAYPKSKSVPVLPSRGLTPFSVAVMRHPVDRDRRADVLARITIQKTVQPTVRAVFYGSVLIGRIARYPYSLGWLASCARSRVFWSIEEAALALVDDARVLE